jgi:phosphopantetheinyl transferase
VGLFYQHNINANTRLGIWRIEEAESFFLEKVPVKKDVSHPYKRLQHLAGRFLLPVLFEDFPLEEILIADTKKPFLPDEHYHFSISHSGNYAAAIVSTQNRVGIDIELVTPRIKTISPKFMNEAEKDFMSEWEPLSQVHLQLMTVLWSSKEAIFKWFGNGEVNFKQHIKLHSAPLVNAGEWTKLNFLFEKSNQDLQVHAKIFDNLSLAYVVS